MTTPITRKVRAPCRFYVCKLLSGQRPRLAPVRNLVVHLNRPPSSHLTRPPAQRTLFSGGSYIHIIKRHRCAASTAPQVDFESSAATQNHRVGDVNSRQYPMHISVWVCAGFIAFARGVCGRVRANYAQIVKAASYVSSPTVRQRRIISGCFDNAKEYSPEK